MTPFGISSTTPVAPALGYAQKEMDISSPGIQDRYLLETGDDLLKEDGDYYLLES